MNLPPILIATVNELGYKTQYDYTAMLEDKTGELISRIQKLVG